MVNKKTNKQRIKNKKTRKTRKRGRTNNKKTKGGEQQVAAKAADNFKKKLMNLDVYITEATDTDKRKIEFDVVTFHEFYDYLNETDMYLKKILTEELLAFTDPSKYEKWNTKPNKKSYEFGYKDKDKKEAPTKKE